MQLVGTAPTASPAVRNPLELQTLLCPYFETYNYLTCCIRQPERMLLRSGKGPGYRGLSTMHMHVASPAWLDCGGIQSCRSV